MPRRHLENQWSRFRGCLASVVLGLTLLTGDTAFGQWAQWGGPDRNFAANTTGLADEWPDAGPKKLWTRPLGTGYSGLAIADGTIYTMYRTKKEDKFEYTIAIDATTGETLWEHKEIAPVPDSVRGVGREFSGPNSTPLVIGKRVFTVGRNAMLLCLNTDDGKVLWQHALNSEFGAQTHHCGFSTSPIAFGNTVILPVGRLEDDSTAGRSLVAFDQVSGDVVWKTQSFQSSYSSPILIEYQRRQQLVHCTNSALIGVDPKDGKLLWEYRYPDADLFADIWITPIWDGTDTILFSSDQAGFAFQLSQEDSRTVAKQLWSSRRTAFGMGTPLLLGDVLVGAKQSRNALFLGVDIRSGKSLWRKRVLPGATVIGDQNKIIALDSDGKLVLATANRKSLTVASEFQLTDKYSFTAPALVGTTLFVRDEKNIMALDLSVAGNK